MILYTLMSFEINKVDMICFVLMLSPALLENEKKKKHAPEFVDSKCLPAWCNSFGLQCLMLSCLLKYANGFRFPPPACSYYTKDNKHVSMH